MTECKYFTSLLSQWFQHRGQRCREDQSLVKAGLVDGSTVHIHLCLRGGGGDGGATGAESRASYLEMYMEKKPDKVCIPWEPEYK